MEFKDIPIVQFWNKWFVKWKGNNKTPSYYLQSARNTRIINQWITVRPWFENIFENTNQTPCRGIIWSDSGLFVVQWWHLKQYNFSTQNLDDLGDIWTDVKCRFVTRGKITMIFTWVWNPWVWDWTTLFQSIKLTWNIKFAWWGINDINAYWGSWNHTFIVKIVSNGTPDMFQWNIDWWAFSASTNCMQYPDWTLLSNWLYVSFNIWKWHTIWDYWTITTNSTYPLFGTSYAWFTIVSKGDNIAYVSRPISPTTLNNCYDWSDSTQWLNMTSNIQGMIGTLFNLWLFTTNSIEYIGKQSLTTTGWIASLYSTPIWRWSQLAWPDACCWAGDKIFYFTSSNKIKTIWFKPWIVEPQIDELSDEPLTWINWWLEDVWPDQSWCKMIFDENENLVKTFLKMNNGNIKCLNYDIINDARHWDDNKSWSDICKYNNQYYAIWNFDNLILHEWSGKVDIDQPIDWEFTTTTLGFGEPANQKMFWWEQFAWTVNNFTNIYNDIIIDDKTVFKWVMKWSDRVWITPLWIWSTTIGWELIGWKPWEATDTLDIFDAVVNHWYLLARWKRIWSKFWGNDSLNPDFLIDFLSFKVAWLKNSYEKSDMKMNVTK